MRILALTTTIVAKLSKLENIVPKGSELLITIKETLCTCKVPMGEATLLALDANAPTGKTKFSAN
jgi:hypothetical protein